MEYEWHKQDGRFSVCSPVVELMVSGAAEICAQLWSSYQYRPFHDNENAGVSILLGGASKKGLLAVSEYPVDKKAWAVIQKKNEMAGNSTKKTYGISLSEEPICGSQIRIFASLSNSKKPLSAMAHRMAQKER